MAQTDYTKIPGAEKEKESCDKSTKYGFGVRHIQGFIFFLSLSLNYAARGHLGVSIVAMTSNNVNKSLIRIENNTTYAGNGSEIFEERLVTEESLGIYRTYDWPKSTQELVHGSFFLGYSIMMFPGGIICQKWGGKLPLQIALFVNAVLSVFSPWIVAWGNWKALCVCRVVQGLTQAGLYPGVHTLLSNWVPINERGTFSGYVYTGSSFGTVLAFQLGGILAYSRFGWPSMFWFVGVASFIGFLILTFFGAPNPAAHKSVSIDERNYIMSAIGEKVKTKSVTPWKSILLSGPVWSAYAAHIGSALCYVFFYIQVPTYMSAILKLNIRNNGLLSSLPYIATIFSSILFGFSSDFITNRNILSLKNARILSNTVATVVPAACILLVSYTTNTYLAVLCFLLTQSSHAAIHTGWLINYMDLSPNYSGVLMATGNTLANMLIVVLPVLVSNVVVDVTNQHQWRMMMFLIVGVLLVTNLIFVIFMSAEVQPWNDTAKAEENNSEPEEVKLEGLKK